MNSMTLHKQESSLLSCKGSNLPDTIRRMLHKTLTVEMQCQVTFTGKEMVQRSGSELSEKQLGFKSVFLPVYKGQLENCQNY